MAANDDAASPESGSGDSELEALPPKVRNRRVRCNGRTVIRYEEDVRQGKEIVHRRGDPILDEDYARQYRPCQGWAANGTDYCAAHGGSTPAAINAAKRTVALSTPNAAIVLERIAMDERQPADVRIKAAVQLLDRGGVRGGVDVNVDVPGWQQMLGKMFGDEDDEQSSTRDDEAADPGGVIRARVRKLTNPENLEPKPAPRKATPRKATKAAPPERPKFEGW